MSRTARTPERTQAIAQRRSDPPGNAGPPLPASVPSFAFLLPPAADGELGRLGNYRVLRLLGRGGMGIVFAAEDVALRRPVALKVMSPELAVDPFHWQRFLREARALAAIKHKHLVTVYQAAQDSGTVYLVMELLEGESLDGRLARDEPADVREILRIGREIAVGLAVLHGHGLIHRDIKPANIWLESPGGRVKILDLGLVQVEHADMQLTEAGMVVGTPAYMSPEQVRGRPLDARTDLFSLGCVLYALCTGRRPFDAETPMAQAAALAADDPPPARELNPAIPAGLSELIEQLLAKNPADRPASASVVAARLRAIGRDPAGGKSAARGRPRPRPFFRRRGVKVVAGLWLLLAGLAVVAVAGKGRTGGRPPEQPGAGGPTADASEVVFLADTPSLVVASRLIDHVPPGQDGTVLVRGRRYPHGIFMHPTGRGEPPAGITYKLGKGYTRFDSAVGFNDSGPEFTPPVVFAVYGDGKRLWASGEVVRQTPVAACDLDVRGVDELRLEVVAPRQPMGAHAVWIDPRLTK